MITKNEIYFYEFYCLDSSKYMSEIVIALQNETTITNEYLARYSMDDVLQDIVDVFFRNSVKTVLVTELYEIGT